MLLVRGRRSRPVGPADAYTYARVCQFEAGVVDTAVYALIDSGRLRVDADHRISVCGQAPDEPVQASVLEVFGTDERLTLAEVRRRASKAQPVRRTRLVAIADGVRLTRGRSLTSRLVLLLPMAVLGVGIARLVNGVRLGRPVGFLVLCLVLTPVLILVAVPFHDETTRA